MTATRRQIQTVVNFPKTPEPAESPNIIPSLRQCVIEIESAIRALSFGSLQDGERAGHHDMVSATFTAPTLANSEFKVYHSLGRRPKGRLVVGQTHVGQLYDVPDKWTPEYVVFKSTRASQGYTVLFL